MSSHAMLYVCLFCYVETHGYEAKIGNTYVCLHMLCDVYDEHQKSANDI